MSCRWYPDGETRVTNLVLLCSYHHRVIHRPGWGAQFDGVMFAVTAPDVTLAGRTTNRSPASSGTDGFQAHRKSKPG